VYILRFDEISDQWELIMFCAVSAQGYHDLAFSPVSSMSRFPIQGIYRLPILRTH